MPEENSSNVTPDFEYLRDALHELVALIADVVTEGEKAPADDHMGFIAHVFLSKQLDHAVGILQLGYHPDTQLIARSMLEGRCQLLWAAEDAGPRALMWREFVLVVDWRTLQEQDARGELVDPATRTTVLRRVEEHGEQFRNPSSTARDPYRREWHPLPSVWAVFRATDSVHLYNDLYRPLSEWHHWSPAGVGRAITHSDGEFVYSAQNEETQTRVLAAAFQCLLHTAAIADRALKLGIGAPLADMRNRYVTRLGSKK